MQALPSSFFMYCCEQFSENLITTSEDMCCYGFTTHCFMIRGVESVNKCCSQSFCNAKRKEENLHCYSRKPAQSESRLGARTWVATTIYCLAGQNFHTLLALQHADTDIVHWGLKKTFA